MYAQPNYINLSETPSTNNYALGLIKQNLAYNFLVVTTEKQTNGKGQYGKTWISEPNKNITLSIIFLVDETQMLEPFFFLAKIALAVRDFVQTHSKQNASIKWMNDIYCNDKKAAGILIETINHATNPKQKWLIVGIGVNVNQTEFEDLFEKATSLKLLGKKEFDINDLTNSLVNTISTFWHFDMSKPTLLEYNLHLYKKEKLVRFRKNNIAFEAIVKSVDAKGRLHLENAMWDCVQYGEVEWVG